MKFGRALSVSRPNKYTSLGISILLLVILISIIFSLFFTGGFGLEGFKEGVTLRKRGNKKKIAPLPKEESSDSAEADANAEDAEEENFTPNTPTNKPTKKPTTNKTPKK
jgi:hypothetical protein